MDLLVLLNQQLDTAGIGDTNADACVLHCAADANRLAGSQSSVVVGLDSFQSLNQAGGVVNDLAVGQDAPGTDCVDVTDLPGSDADLLGHHVQQGLGGEAGLSNAEATECACGRIVGVVCGALDFEVFVSVGTCCMGTCTLQNGAAQRCVCTGVGLADCLNAQDLTVVVTAHGEVHDEVMTLGMDQQGLCTGQVHLDGTLGVVDSQSSQMLNGHVFLAAEAAANQSVLNLDLLVAQHQLALVEGLVSRLVSGVDEDVAIFIDESCGCFGLQECMLRPGSFEVMGDDMGSLGNSFLSVAAADVLVSLDVGSVGFEDQGSAFCLCIFDAGDMGQDLIFDLDQLLSLFQGSGVFSNDQDDCVAQVVGQFAHGNQGVLVVLQVTDHVLAGDVSCGDALDNALQGLSLGGVDGENAGTGILGANNTCVGGVLGVDVVGVLAEAQDLFFNVQTMDAVTDMPVSGGSAGDNAAFSEDLGSQLDSGNDLHITGAAAVVITQGVLDLIIGRIEILVQQSLGTHDHAGDAEAALNSTSFAVSIGVQFLLLGSQTFNGDNVLANQTVSGGNTGLAGFAINNNSTCTAGTLRAAVLDRSQAQVVTQVTQQGLLLGNGALNAVNGKSICTHLRNPFLTKCGLGRGRSPSLNI